MKPKTKIITLEGTSEVSNAELARMVEEVIRMALADSDFSLTQKVRVQVAQQSGSKEQANG